jgi:hypothetical protein
MKPPALPGVISLLDNPTVLQLLSPSKVAHMEREQGAIEIERRWSTKELNGKEILESLATVYGLLANMVLDAHSQLEQLACIPERDEHRDFPFANDRTGLLRCMVESKEKKRERFNFSTKEELIPTSKVVAMTPDPVEVAMRYGLSEKEKRSHFNTLDPETMAEWTMRQAKRILRRDKCHDRMMFIRDGEGNWQLNTLFARDRTEKHLLMRMAAQFVESRGCDAIVEVGEMWTAPLSLEAIKYATSLEQYRDREEALLVVVATRDGFFRRYTTPFRRGPFGGLKLGDTVSDSDAMPHLQPIIDVWKKQRLYRSQTGDLSSVWEPDALDQCPCGGPDRYAECCRESIRNHFEMDKLRERTEAALEAGELKNAEYLARTGLAQYVIWVKQHTVATMNVAKNFHSKIVPIDALALEANISILQRVLVAKGQSEEILPRLRRLRDFVGDPQLAMRMTALASEWLFESGKPEEAVLELEVLGGIGEITDSRALMLVAGHWDLTEKEQAIRRAISFATCEDEKHIAQLRLAQLLAKRKAHTEASSHLASIIKDTEVEPFSRLRCAALKMTWMISKSDKDFAAALTAMRNARSGQETIRNGIFLVDAGKYAEAEDLLSELVKEDNVAAKLILVDGRIRRGESESAFELFNSIRQSEIGEDDRYPYTQAMSLLVLFAGHKSLRETAIEALRGIPPHAASVDQSVKEMISLLEQSQ